MVTKCNFKSQRSIGLVFTYVSTLLILGLFVKFVLPQLIDSIIGLINDIPMYISQTNRFINKLMFKFNINREQMQLIHENFNKLIDYVIRFVTNLLPVLGTIITNFAASVWNVILGVIVSIYLLIEKEKFCALSKKIIYAIFPMQMANKTFEIAHKSNDIFGKFLIGKILDSFIIGVLAFVILTICKIPYSLLTAVIIGITNVIPFFGPFIGAIPSFIIIFFISPIKALWFLVIVFLLQQLDGNIIGPKILGDSIGISAFWILFSILVAGKLLGVVGMIIGVPLFAVVYSLLKESIEIRLRKKGLKTETSDYKN